MKNKFIITITDIHGTKQYTLHQIIKKLIFWIILLIVLVVGLAVILSQVLMKDVESLRSQTARLEKKAKQLQNKNRHLLQKKERLEQFTRLLILEQQDLEERNRALEERNKALEESIKEQKEKLFSLNDKLKEVEKILGIDEVATAENNISTIPKRVQNLKKQSLVYFSKIKKLSKYEKRLLHRTIPIGLPVRYRRISARFGYRMHPIYHKKMFHFGLDLSAPIGRVVYAPADGVVFFAGVRRGYGKFLILSHPFGFSTAYGHLSKILVRPGQYVKRGEPIAKVGNTGRSTGPHLHYEVRYLSYWLNPMKFLYWDRKNDFASMKRISKVDWNGLLKVLRKRYLSVQVVKKEKE